MSGFSLYTAERVKQEQYKDLLRQAEEARLVRQVLAQTREGRPLLSRALAWLVRRLEARQSRGQYRPAAPVAWPAERQRAAMAERGEAGA